MLCKKLRMTVCRAEAASFLSGGLISYKQNKNNNNCSVLPLDLLYYQRWSIKCKSMSGIVVHDVL